MPRVVCVCVFEYETHLGLLQLAIHADVVWLFVCRPARGLRVCPLVPVKSLIHTTKCTYFCVAHFHSHTVRPSVGACVRGKRETGCARDFGFETMEGAAPVPAPFLSPPEVNEALTKLWQRHVACSVGLGGLADANLDAAALQALAPLAQYCDTYRDPRIHRVFAEALDMDPGAVVGPDVVRKMAMTAVAKRHAALFCDGTPDAAGSQDWVTQYRPVTADEVRVWWGSASVPVCD